VGFPSRQYDSRAAEAAIFANAGSDCQFAECRDGNKEIGVMLCGCFQKMAGRRASSWNHLHRENERKVGGRCGNKKKNTTTFIASAASKK